MGRRRRRKIRVIDEDTGQEMIVFQNQAYRPLVQQQSQYLEPQYHHPTPVRKRRRRHPTSQREHYRRESKARFAGSFFAGFILSWAPCAFGAPGLTLAIWG